MEIIAHRGLSSSAPENTILSIEKALEIQCPVIEIDCQLTADNQIVVFHDHIIKQDVLLQKDFMVHDLTYEELKHINLRDDQKIPLLEDVLAVVQGKTDLMLETKNQGCSLAILNLIGLRGYHYPIHITSPIVSEVLTIKQYNPLIPVSLVLNQFVTNLDEIAHQYRINQFSLNHNYIQEHLIKQLKRNEYVIRVFTVNDLAEAQLYESWGIDAIFTDKPQIFLKSSSFSNTKQIKQTLSS